MTVPWGASPPPGQEWSLHFEDIFGNVDTSRWFRYHSTYGDGNNEEQHYRPENLLADGTLTITAMREAYNGRDFTSGFLSTGTRGNNAQPEPAADTFLPRAGFYEARMKVPQAHGLLPAFWMRHRAGAGVAECDVMEVFHDQRPGTTDHTLHLDGDTNTFKASPELQDPTTEPEWHTWGVAITEEGNDVRFTFFLDGSQTGSHLAANPAFWHDHTEPNLWDVSLNLAVGGDWVGHPDDPLGYSNYLDQCLSSGTPPSCDTTGLIAPSFPELLEVDYIRVWTLTGSPTGIIYQHYDDGTAGQSVPVVAPFTHRVAQGDNFGTYTDNAIHGDRAAYYSGAPSYSQHGVEVGSRTAMRLRGYVRRATDPSGTTSILGVRNVADGSLAELRMETTGEIVHRQYTPWTNLGQTPAWPVDTVWRVEYEIVNAGSSTQGTLRVWTTDPESTGSPDHESTGTFAEDVARIDIGNLNGNGLQVTWDSVAVSDGEAIGPIALDPGEPPTEPPGEDDPPPPEPPTPPPPPTVHHRIGQWRVVIAETRTGLIHADVLPRDLPAFTRRTTDKGSWTVNVVPEDRANAHLDLHTYTDAGRFSWAVLYDDYVVQAGPTWTYGYDENTRNLSVSGTGIQGIFDRRIVRNSSGTGPITHVSQDLVLNDLSLRGIAQQLVANATFTAPAQLPIDLPAAEAGTRTRTYQGYDLAMVWDRLVDLSKVIDGPEIDFRPYITSEGTHLRWEMLIGGPLLGDPESLAVWDYGGALSQIDLDVNGAASPATSVYVKGSGTEREMVTAFAFDNTLVELGYPPTDYVNSEHMSVTESSTLLAYAQADLKAYAAAVETWKSTVRVDGFGGSPALGEWGLGDAPVFGVSGHPWIRDGQYRRRIHGYNSNDESTVELDLESIPEED